jgi:hypothetical protein
MTLNDGDGTVTAGTLLEIANDGTTTMLGYPGKVTITDVGTYSGRTEIGTTTGLDGKLV